MFEPAPRINVAISSLLVTLAAALCLFPRAAAAETSWVRVPCLEVSTGRCLAVPPSQCGVSSNYKYSDECASTVVRCLVKNLTYPKGECLALTMSECLTQHGDFDARFCQSDVTAGCGSVRWLVCNLLPGAGNAYAENYCAACLVQPVNLGENAAPQATPGDTSKAHGGTPEVAAGGSPTPGAETAVEKGSPKPRENASDLGDWGKRD